MRSRRAICVSRDSGWRSAIEGSLRAAGIAVEHTARLPDDPGDAALVVVDRETRRAQNGLVAAVAAPVVIVGDDLDDDELIALMHDPPVSHHIEDPTDRILAITSEKLASGDVFGLEKYLAPGVKVRARAIASDADKRHAVGAITAWAQVFARRPLVHRIANVADELMMNALYNTPAVAGQPRAAELRWAVDDDAIALSVSDPFGALRQRDVLAHVRRARQDRGRPRPKSERPRGAGLGLYLVIANVASLVVNVESGKRTEVVCLFDRPPARGPAASPVRSLHVFQAAS